MFEQPTSLNCPCPSPPPTQNIFPVWLSMLSSPAPRRLRHPLLRRGRQKKQLSDPGNSDPVPAENPSSGSESHSSVWGQNLTPYCITGVGNTPPPRIHSDLQNLVKSRGGGLFQHGPELEIQICQNPDFSKNRAPRVISREINVKTPKSFSRRASRADFFAFL